MARTDNFTNFATDVADSIREMTGETGLIPASEFDTKIKSIETKEDLDDELTIYNTEVTEQSILIDTIIDALQGKASGGGSSSTLIEEPVDLATLNKTNISVKQDGSTATYAGWYLYKTTDVANVKQVKFTNVPCYYNPSNGLYLYGIVFYDESNNFISGIGVNEVDEDEREKLAENVDVNEYLLASTKVIPAGAKYMDVCSYTINNNTYDPTIILLKESTSGVGNGSSNVEEKYLNFFDYDGTLLYSYDKTEVQTLTELPALPEHEGLLCQGWNWDLDDIKSVNQELDVGPMYITDDGKTRLYIEIDKPAGFTLTIYFKQSIANGVTIDWGDGSDLYTPTTTGNQNKAHTYPTGNYVLTIDVNDNCEFKFGNDNATGISVLGSNSNYDKPMSIIKKVQLGKNVFLNDYAFFKSYGIKSITIPNTMFSVNASCLAYVYPLKFLVLPKNSALIITGNYTLYSLENLELISLPKNYTWDNVGMSANEAMKRTPYINDTVGSIADSAFQTCFEIEKIVMPNVTTVGNNLYSYTYNLKVLDFTRCTSVPQLSGSLAYNNRMSYTFKILVPSALYDEWITASGWSTYKDYISPA